MKKYLEGYVKGLSIGLGILTIVGVSGIAYGAYVAISDVAPNDTLTASTFNQVLANMSSLKTSVDNAAPAGAVMAFNLSSCPSGWIAADGTNSTPDLRGEFIRGLDGGRGIDSGRTLASWQNATRVFRNNTTNIGYNGGLYDHDHFISSDYDGNIESVSGGAYNYAAGLAAADSRAVYGVRVRPRNVALLYCVKQ